MGTWTASSLSVTGACSRGMLNKMEDRGLTLKSSWSRYHVGILNNAPSTDRPDRFFEFYRFKRRIYTKIRNMCLITLLEVIQPPLTFYYPTSFSLLAL
jgi:hypothetical protein